MNNASNLLKLIAGAGLNGLWAALVFTGKADALPLVTAIGAQLSALLGYQAVTNLQSVSTPPASPPVVVTPVVPVASPLTQESAK